MCVLFRNVNILHHVGGGSELKEISNGEIEAIWSMGNQLIFTRLLGVIPLEVHGGGYYHETWTFWDGDWKLKSLRLERTYTRSSLAVQLCRRWLVTCETLNYWEDHLTTISIEDRVIVLIKLPNCELNDIFWK
jgi:hypothetical protein